jgi:hypothetical protein
MITDNHGYSIEMASGAEFEGFNRATHALDQPAGRRLPALGGRFTSDGHDGSPHQGLPTRPAICLISIGVRRAVA